MSDVEEMFLKAANFHLIIKEGPWISAVGYGIKTRFGEYGSFFLTWDRITEQMIEEATSVFKEEALGALLRLIGRRI